MELFQKYQAEIRSWIKSSLIAIFYKKAERLLFCFTGNEYERLEAADVNPPCNQ